MNKENKNIASLLQTNTGSFSKWMSYVGLGIGVLLLLSSMQMFININEVLKGSSPRKNGFDFISVTKVITNENMGKDNTFTDGELNDLQHQQGVDAAAPLISNQYRVKASAGNIIPFSTDLFLESIDDEFIDTVPPTFKWQKGQQNIPIIFSSDFLEMYNVFAPSQGLPQLSARTISSVNIIIECHGPTGIQNFSGNIVALTDRINSVLVPKSFMDWSNKQFGGTAKAKPARIYIKTRDANNAELISYFDQKNFHVNKDRTKFGRVKKVLQNIVTSLAFFGVLVIVLALMLFSFYLQLMIARSKDNLQLLMTLGYSPNWLSRTVARTWVSVYALVIAAAIILTEILHYVFVTTSVIDSHNLSYILHWSVIVVGILLLLLSIYSNYRLVRKELDRIG
jgi:hypothetical protein